MSLANIEKMKRHPRGQFQRVHMMSPSLLMLLYTEQRQTARQIATRLGCSLGTVYWNMRRYGIARRDASEKQSGVLSHRLGKAHSEEAKARISASLVGVSCPARGRAWSPERRAKMSALAKARGVRPPRHPGSSHWNWKGGIHVANERERQQVALRHWRASVYKRDAFTCQVCHRVGGRLNAHHIKHWAKFPEGRFDVTNGVTLCEVCHAITHGKCLHGGRNA